MLINLNFFTFTSSGSTVALRRAEHINSIMIYIRRGWFSFSSLFCSVSFLSLYMFMLTLLFLVGPLVLHKRQRDKSKWCFWRHIGLVQKRILLVQKYDCSVYFPGYFVLYHNAVPGMGLWIQMSSLHSWQMINVMYILGF